MLYFGEHGGGKTVSVKLMFKSFGYEIVEYNETTTLDKKNNRPNRKVSQNNGLNKFLKQVKKGIVIECVEKF